MPVAIIPPRSKILVDGKENLWKDYGWWSRFEVLIFGKIIFALPVWVLHPEIIYVKIQMVSEVLSIRTSEKSGQPPLFCV
jgi:hypothetical protein